MSDGYLCLLLHAHLPFVRHPEEDYCLEENWLFEAITETYLPLLDIFERLIADGIDFRLAMTLSPPLVSMLTDPLLQNRYLRHLNRLIELADKEIERTGLDHRFHGLALMYRRIFQEAKNAFTKKYKKDLVTVFKRLQKEGHLEILASCATHGFLPNLSIHPEDVRAQIFIGIDHYKKTFRRPPKGFWLPECGYTPGVDAILRQAGIRYFFLDSHGFLKADPAPRHGVYAPIYCPTGVAAFGRDGESSKQVWSATEGYPGDPFYREYYKDLGHELDFDYIKPYIHPQGLRVDTGIKYWRITGKTEIKEPYQPDLATQRAAQHADEFMLNRKKQVHDLSRQMKQKPIVVAPYDAELFGHWWFEGPQWLNFLIRKIFHHSHALQLITPSEYLREYPVNQMCRPAASSWGMKGHNEMWLDESNDWIYRHLHTAGQRMKHLTHTYLRHRNKTAMKPRLRRALNQAAVELLLAQASDWPFIMKSGTAVVYAQKRVKQHIARFTYLYRTLLQGKVDPLWLKDVESRDNIFRNIDCARYFRDVESKTQPRKTALYNKALSLDGRHG